MTVDDASLPHRAPRAKSTPSARQKRPASAQPRVVERAQTGSGAGAALRRCCVCNRQLSGRHQVTCSDSCKSALSRMKRQQVDDACILAFHWKPDDGQRLLDQFGLKRMEWALNQRGVHWYAEEKCWRFDETKGQDHAA